VLDLTRIPLERLNCRSIPLLVVRKEYQLAYDTICERAKSTRAIYLVTGQPGIGTPGWSYPLGHQLILLDRENILPVVPTCPSAAGEECRRPPDRPRLCYSL